MKAIKITQEIKDKNKKYGISWLTKPTDTIIAVPFPNSFYVNQPVSGGYKTRTDLHEADGWKVPEIPEYDPKTHKLGDIEEVIFKAGEEDEYSIFRYTIIAKSQQEIEADAMAENSQNKRQLLQEIAEAKILEEAQLNDDHTALKNQALYPIWTFPFFYDLDFKVQDFNNENELVLYKAVQAHESQENWRPKDVPALFVRVAYEGEILDWVQPAGAHDAYQIGDKVKHKGDVWISIIDNNIWEPSVYGWEIFVK